MLDVLADSEVSPSLQNETKATFTADSFSITQSQAESLVPGSTTVNDLVMETPQFVTCFWRTIWLHDNGKCSSSESSRKFQVLALGSDFKPKTSLPPIAKALRAPVA